MSAPLPRGPPATAATRYVNPPSETAGTSASSPPPSLPGGAPPISHANSTSPQSSVSPKQSHDSATATALVVEECAAINGSAHNQPVSPKSYSDPGCCEVTTNPGFPPKQAPATQRSGRRQREAQQVHGAPMTSLPLRRTTPTAIAKTTLVLPDTCWEQQVPTSRQSDRFERVQVPLSARNAESAPSPQAATPRSTTSLSRPKDHGRGSCRDDTEDAGGNSSSDGRVGPGGGRLRQRGWTEGRHSVEAARDGLRVLKTSKAFADTLLRVFQVRSVVHCARRTMSILPFCASRHVYTEPAKVVHTKRD